MNITATIETVDRSEYPLEQRRRELATRYRALRQIYDNQPDLLRVCKALLVVIDAQDWDLCRLGYGHELNNLPGFEGRDIREWAGAVIARAEGVATVDYHRSEDIPPDYRPTYCNRVGRQP